MSGSRSVILVAALIAGAGIYWYRAPHASPHTPHSQHRAPDAPGLELPQWARQTSAGAPPWAKGFVNPNLKFDGEGGNCADRCSDLVQVGKSVTEMRVASDPPVPQGGALTPGTYVLTEMTLYTGPNGESGPTDHERSFTMRIGAIGAQTRIDTAYVHGVDKCVNYQQGAMVETSGIWMRVMVSCWTGHPAPQELVQAYTVTPDKLIMFPSPHYTWTFVAHHG